MAENGEGNKFRGVQDRLRMFEQTKPNVGTPEARPTGAVIHNQEVKVVSPGLTKPVPRINDISKTSSQTTASISNRNVATKPPPSLNAKPPVKSLPPTQSPPGKTLPPTVTPPAKMAPQTVTQPAKVAPPTVIPPAKITLSTVTPPAKTTPPPVTSLTRMVAATVVAAPRIITSKTPSSTAAPPVRNPPLNLKPPETSSPSEISNPEQNETSVINSKLPPSNVLQGNTKSNSKVPPVRAPPPTMIQLETNTEVEKAQPTSAHVPVENIPHPCQKTVPHPPAPTPPNDVSTDKNRSSTDSNQFDAPPPVPPPPPHVTKSQMNILVGWVTSTSNGKNTKENFEVSNPNVETSTKVTEPNKPPPILVAPPTIESFERVTKINASSFPDDDVDTYDEDDDCSNNPWYFDVSKSKATQIMRDCVNIGKFIVRPSDNNQYVLMIRAESEIVKKFKIQHNEGGWVLGDPSNGKRRHPSIASLIEFYCQNGVKVGNSILKLTEPVSNQ